MHLTNYRNKPGFLLILPDRLQYGKNNTACLSLYNIAVPVDAAINLKIMEKDYTLMQQSFDKSTIISTSYVIGKTE